MNIGVFDSTSSRRELMAKLFANQAEVFCWGSNTAPSSWDKITLSEQPLRHQTLPSIGLMLIHGNNVDAFELAAISSPCVVWYGGHRGGWRGYPKLLSRGVDVDKIYEAQGDSAITLTEKDGLELVAYAGAVVSELCPTKPRCLLPPPDPSVLNAIAILSQGFFASGVSGGKITVDDELLGLLGWDRLQTKTLALLSDPLSGLWPEVIRIQWWRRSLGVSSDGGKNLDPEDYRRLLANLVAGLFTNAEAIAILSLTPRQRIEDKTELELLVALRTLTDATAIVALLERLKTSNETDEDEVDAATLIKVCKQIAGILSNR